MSLDVGIYVWVNDGAPHEPRSARLPRRPLSFIVEFIFVPMLVFMFVSGVCRMASLALLASLAARFR